MVDVAQRTRSPTVGDLAALVLFKRDAGNAIRWNRSGQVDGRVRRFTGAVDRRLLPAAAQHAPVDAFVDRLLTKGRSLGNEHLLFPFLGAPAI